MVSISVIFTRKKTGLIYSQSGALNTNLMIIKDILRHHLV